MPPMMVTYDELIAWGSPDNNTAYRPYCWIRVHGPRAPNAWDGWGLLDTGADFLILPAAVRRILKIDIVNCSEEKVEIASGKVDWLPQTFVDVTIRRKRINKVKVIFGTGTIPLIGLHTILAAMEFGIEFNGWLYRRI